MDVGGGFKMWLITNRQRVQHLSLISGSAVCWGHLDGTFNLLHNGNKINKCLCNGWHLGQQEGFNWGPPELNTWVAWAMEPGFLSETCNRSAFSVAHVQRVTCDTLIRVLNLEDANGSKMLNTCIILLTWEKIFLLNKSGENPLIPGEMRKGTAWKYGKENK